MTRVLSVVDRSIMVHIHDVVVGDILYVRGDEGDPIIEYIERDGDKVRFHYKERPQTQIQIELGFPPVLRSNWMDPNAFTGGRTFIHDLKNERAEFLDSQPVHGL